jgi:hypothetical protein
MNALTRPPLVRSLSTGWMNCGVRPVFLVAAPRRLQGEDERGLWHF